MSGARRRERGGGEGRWLPDVGVDSLPRPPAIPRSVASLYFAIFAFDMRWVKWNTDTDGPFGADMSVLFVRYTKEIPVQSGVTLKLALWG